MKKSLIWVLLSFILIVLTFGCTNDDNNSDGTVVKFRNITSEPVTVVINDATNVSKIISPDDVWSYTLTDDVIDASWDVHNSEYVLSFTVVGRFIKNNQGSVKLKLGKSVTKTFIADTAVLKINNVYSGKTINDVMLRDDELSPWNGNILDNPISPSESTYIQVAAGIYDVILKFNDGTSVISRGLTFKNDNETSFSFPRTFKVTNNTWAAITFKLDGEHTTNVPGQESRSIELDSSFGSTVHFWANGLYIDVITEDYTVGVGEELTVSIDADGGAINIRNNSSANITEVYLMDNSSSGWGVDYMSTAIQSGSTYAWTVAPGVWKIKLVDDEGYSTEVLNQSIALNQTLNVDYSDKKRLKLFKTGNPNNEYPEEKNQIYWVKEN